MTRRLRRRPPSTEVSLADSHVVVIGHPLPARAYTLVGFQVACPHCHHVCNYRPHLEAEHAALSRHLISALRVLDGGPIPAALDLPTACQHCRQPFAITALSLE